MKGQRSLERGKWREQRKQAAARERMQRIRQGVAVEEVEEEEEEEDWVQGNATEILSRGKGGDESRIRDMIRAAMPRLCPEYDKEQLEAWKAEGGAKVHVHKAYTDPGAGRTLKTGRGRFAALSDHERLRRMRGAAIDRLKLQDKAHAAEQHRQQAREKEHAHAELRQQDPRPRARAQ